MTLAILQARMSSTRLPGKVLKLINGKPMIYWQINRISRSTEISKIVIATTTDSTDDDLVNYLKFLNVPFVRGSIQNVKGRFDEVLRNFPRDSFVRLTADCPLVMPKLIDQMVAHFNDNSGLDYLSNTIDPTFPDGLDIEIVNTRAFSSLNLTRLSQLEQEHVTYGLYARHGKFNVMNYNSSKDLSDLRWTVDYKQDLAFVRKVYNNFKGKEFDFTMEEVLDFLTLNPKLRSRIDSSRRNESLKKFIDKKNEPSDE